MLFLRCGSDRRDRLAWPALESIGYSKAMSLANTDTHPSSMICSLQHKLRVGEAPVKISLTSPMQVDGKGRLTVDHAREGGRENGVSGGDG